ncbi:MAG: pyrroline-5-carboxylate reductase [Tatlockia sp.]|nr:pyrroline-5-carboxylate reductase [Tatlockia sp.]
MKICFIGFGNMAKAIAEGLCNHSSNYQIVATAPSLKEGRTSTGIVTTPDNLAGLANADLIILAVKPSKMAEVLSQIKTKLPEHCLLLSVAAGLSLKWLEQHCPEGQAIIRSMPNLPATIEKGATPLIANQHVSSDQKRWTEELFNCSGIISWTNDENDIDAFTALSGSGPAYVFLFLEAMIDAAKKLGLNEDIAKRFALQTMAGAVEMATLSDLAIDELRKKVTSPAGTTAAAIAVFEDQGFKELIFKAMSAAKARAEELSSN